MFLNIKTTQVFDYLPLIIIPAILATLKMLFLSLILGLIIGFFIGVFLVLFSPDGLMPKKFIYYSLNGLVNFVRSFPVIILIVALIPFTRFIIGTSVGWQAAVVPLTISAFCAIARLIENSLLEVDKKVILAAKSFGASNRQIIFNVMLIEALPAIFSNLVFSSIQVLANTTLAGAVGAGGLGAMALTFGYQRFDEMMMYSIVLVLTILVFIIQSVGSHLYKKLK